MCKITAMLKPSVIDKYCPVHSDATGGDPVLGGHTAQREFENEARSADYPKPWPPVEPGGDPVLGGFRQSQQSVSTTLCGHNFQKSAHASCEAE